MKKINILYILPKAQQGGAEQQLLYLLKGIDRKKFKINLGFLYKCKEMKKEFETIDSINVIYFNKKNKFDVSVFFKISKFIKSEKIDIVHAFLGNHHAYLPSMLAEDVISVGGIMDSRYKELSIISKIKKFYIGKLISKHKKYYLVSCSNSGKEIYLNQGYPKESLFFIPNGIDYSKFSKGNSDKVKKEYNLKNKFVLGTVGRLIESKNHKDLITMFETLDKKYDNLSLLIIGDGPFQNTLKKIVKSKKLSDKIIFTGNRKDISDLLATINIFVFASLTEGWPNVIGEAMAAGIPVVTYNVGDTKNIIDNGINGFVVDNSIDQLTNVTEALINNPKLGKKIGQNAKKTIIKDYSIKQMNTKYEKFYANIIKKEKKKNDNQTKKNSFKRIVLFRRN